VGNAFLTLTQQGWLAPREIGRAVTLARKLGPEDTRLVDMLMGEGVTTSLKAMGERGPISSAVTAAAAGYGKIVDLPFRRASFLYEARRAGYKNAAQIKRLLHDDAEKA